MTGSARHQSVSEPLNSRYARQSFLIGTSWSAAGVIVSRLLLMLGMVASARQLGLATFGQLGLLQQSVLQVAVVISYGFGLTGAKYVAEVRHSDRARAGRILAFVLLASTCTAISISCVTLAAAPWLAEVVLCDASLTQPLMLSVPWILFAAGSLTIQVCLTGLLAFREAASIQVLEAVTGATLGVAGAAVWGLSGAVVGFGIGAAIGCLTSACVLRFAIRSAMIPVRLDLVRSALHEGRMLAGFWIPSTAEACVVLLIGSVCPVVLARSPSGFIELAMFNAANYWFNMLVMMPNILQRVGTAVQASALGRNNASDAAMVRRTTLLVNLALSGFGALPLMLFSPQLLALFGPQYRNGWPTMWLCVGTAICVSIVKPAEQTLKVAGRAWLSLSLHALLAIIYFIAFVPLVSFGAVGLAAARLIAYSMHSITMSVAIGFEPARKQDRQFPAGASAQTSAAA